MKLPTPDPTALLDLWEKLRQKPLGKRIFSKIVGATAPYTGTIGAQVLDLAPGHARVELADRHKVRNHLRSIHAVALMNLGELTTGLAMMSSLPAGSRGIVTGLSMRYLKKARGTLIAESRIDPPVGAGKHDCEVIGEIRNTAGEVVAEARAQWRIDIP
ncbi:MAG TPA: hotdog fold domain-containing protein [Nannocystaceae bacterium]|nr:hotdog fold domain-containing protein [Nannocystaceae bacterium]